MDAISFTLLSALFFTTVVNAGESNQPPSYQERVLPEASSSTSKPPSTIERKFIERAPHGSEYIIDRQRRAERIVQQKTTTEDGEKYIRRQIAKHGAPTSHSSQTKDMGMAGKLKTETFRFETKKERITKEVRVTTPLDK